MGLEWCGCGKENELSHSVTQSLSHSVTQSLSHSVTQSLSHSVTQSLSHSVTQSHSVAQNMQTRCTQRFEILHHGTLEESFKSKMFPVLHTPISAFSWSSPCWLWHAPSHAGSCKTVGGSALQPDKNHQHQKPSMAQWADNETQPHVEQGAYERDCVVQRNGPSKIPLTHIDIFSGIPLPDNQLQLKETHWYNNCMPLCCSSTDNDTSGFKSSTQAQAIPTAVRCPHTRHSALPED